jgi:hypothetical protein
MAPLSTSRAPGRPASDPWTRPVRQRVVSRSRLSGRRQRQVQKFERHITGTHPMCISTAHGWTDNSSASLFALWLPLATLSLPAHVIVFACGRQLQYAPRLAAPARESPDMAPTRAPLCKRNGERRGQGVRDMQRRNLLSHSLFSLQHAARGNLNHSLIQ